MAKQIILADRTMSVLCKITSEIITASQAGNWINPIDYSEQVTEPDLTLSMRQIVQRFVNKQPLGIPSMGVYQELPDSYEEPELEDMTDVMLSATELRQRAEEKRILEDAEIQRQADLKRRATESEQRSADLVDDASSEARQVESPKAANEVSSKETQKS